MTENFSTALHARVSYKGRRGTVRFKGALKGRGDKIWLGIEWDDEDGKHNGTFEGTTYFKCLSPSPTAASFVAITAKQDEKSTFLQAVRRKYVSEDTFEPAPSVESGAQIEISGKVVEEVGFDKIRQQLSRLHELKNVIVDGQCIGSVSNEGEDIAATCPSIEHLDLSKNLIQYFDQVVNICKKLPRLRKLKINDNRLEDILLIKPDIVSDKVTSFTTQDRATHYRKALGRIEELELKKTLLTWNELVVVVSYFNSLKSLDFSRNYLSHICNSLESNTLTQLILDHNGFTTLSDILLLGSLPFLEVLRLKANKIAFGKDSNDTRTFGHKLKYLDLSSNAVANWQFVDALPDVFPGLKELRFSDNPVYGNTSTAEGITSAPEEGHMFTVARIAQLEQLNFRKIAPAERADAEMFYLTKIGKDLAQVPETQEHLVIAKHKRYEELCLKYEKPSIVRHSATEINPSFLEARLIKFKFYLPPNYLCAQPETIIHITEIPRAFDIYRVKGIVGELFGLRPYRLQLIWETGEWDPVAGYQDDGVVRDEEDEIMDDEEEASRENGRMVRREVELQDGTRLIGNCVDGMEATVRVVVPKL